MASAAKRSFDKTLDRVLGPLSLHGPLHGIKGRPRQDVSDILRPPSFWRSQPLDALVVDCVSGTFRHYASQATPSSFASRSRFARYSALLT
jgi:hypothetical protein